MIHVRMPRQGTDLDIVMLPVGIGVVLFALALLIGSSPI